MDVKKFKTEICKAWELLGTCPYSKECTFAHGKDDIRTKETNEKYKTKDCDSFFSKGYCKYGQRCLFSHKLDNKRFIYFTYLLLFKQF